MCLILPSFCIAIISRHASYRLATEGPTECSMYRSRYVVRSLRKLSATALRTPSAEYDCAKLSLSARKRSLRGTSLSESARPTSVRATSRLSVSVSVRRRSARVMGSRGRSRANFVVIGVVLGGVDVPESSSQSGGDHAIALVADSEPRPQADARHAPTIAQRNDRTCARRRLANACTCLCSGRRNWGEGGCGWLVARCNDFVGQCLDEALEPLAHRPLLHDCEQR